MKISIFGIGYVGAVAAACLAEQGHEVIAVDIDPSKVHAINNGLAPVVEAGLEERVRQNVSSGRLSATANAEAAVRDSDLSFVCVGTPSGPSGAINTQYVAAACKRIGKAIAAKGKFHSVVVRSTIVPGTMEAVCIPALESASGLEAGVDFGVGYCPEFLREGTAIKDYHDPGLIVFGAIDARTEAMLRQLNRDMPVPCSVVSLPTAEAVKYASNSWRAVKITFANEIGNIAKACGIDGQTVMSLICSDTKVNISPHFMRPGFAFGGSCLPKDVRALKSLADSKSLDVPILSAVLQGNDLQIDRAERMLGDVSGAKRVGLVGVSFKPGTNDLRESPLAMLAARLISKGRTVNIYDPYVTIAFARGPEGAERPIVLSEIVPDIGSRLVPRISDLIAMSDIILVGNRYEETIGPLNAAIGSRQIVDLARISPTLRSNGQYEGICW